MMKFSGMVNVWTGSRYFVDNKKKRLERMRSRVIAWAKLQPVGGWYCMLVLTYDTMKTKYETGKDWEARDITEFVRLLKRDLAKRGVKLWGYAWTAEIQPSGHVHYNLLLHLNKKIFRFYADKLGLWRWGDTSFTPARTVGYIVKYASKGTDDVGEFPTGLRIFAVWVAEKEIAKLLILLFEPLWKLRARAAGFSEADIKEFGKPDLGWRYVASADNLEYLNLIMDSSLAGANLSGS